MISLGENSYITESDFYSHLNTRLNSDEYNYLAAIYEAGVNEPEIAEVLNNNLGATLADIEAILNASSVSYDQAALQQSYNLLAAGKTSIQIRNTQALILATQLIDRLEFVGSPTDTAQLLQWPRVNVVNRNGQTIPADTISVEVERATAELALILLRYDLTDPRQQQHLYLLTSEMVGESQVTLAKNPNRKLTTYVMDLLKPFLREKSAFSSELLF